MTWRRPPPQYRSSYRKTRKLPRPMPCPLMFRCQRRGRRPPPRRRRYRYRSTLMRRRSASCCLCRFHPLGSIRPGGWQTSWIMRRTPAQRSLPRPTTTTGGQCRLFRPARQAILLLPRHLFSQPCRHPRHHLRLARWLTASKERWQHSRSQSRLPCRSTMIRRERPQRLFCDRRRRRPTERRYRTKLRWQRQRPERTALPLLVPTCRAVLPPPCRSTTIRCRMLRCLSCRRRRRLPERRSRTRLLWQRQRPERTALPLLIPTCRAVLPPPCRSTTIRCRMLRCLSCRRRRRLPERRSRTRLRWQRQRPDRTALPLLLPTCLALPSPPCRSTTIRCRIGCLSCRRRRRLPERRSRVLLRWQRQRPDRTALPLLIPTCLALPPPLWMPRRRR